MSEEVIKFKLKGNTGFFKKPDVNTYLYYTYGNIHKIALLGIFGAILGYGGYNKMSFDKKYKNNFNEKTMITNIDYPEFYDKLKQVKVGIKPNKNTFNKKVQTYNNSVGYASKEQGGNLIIKEQWLEKPSWDVFLIIKDTESKNIAKAIVERSFVFMPYLGKNDHPASITDVEILKNINEEKNPKIINSLFKKNYFKIENNKTDDLDNLLSLTDIDEEDNKFKYEEKLPILLEKKTNKYKYENLVFTNMHIEKKQDIPVYKILGDNITFI